MQFREGRLIWVPSLRAQSITTLTEQAWQQELEAAGYIASVARQWREIVLILNSHSPFIPSLWMVLSAPQPVDGATHTLFCRWRYPCSSLWSGTNLTSACGVHTPSLWMASTTPQPVECLPQPEDGTIHSPGYPHLNCVFLSQ